MFFKNLLIQQKLNFLFIGLIVLSVIVLSGFSIANNTNFSQESAKIIESEMINEEIAKIERIATDKALYVNEFLESITIDVMFLKEYSEDVFNNRINYSFIETYWADVAIDSRLAPGNEIVEDYYGLGYANWDASTIFVPNIDSEAEFQTFLTNNQDFVDQTAALEYAFRVIHASNPNYIWIYAGFENNNIFRQLPYNDMSYFREIEYTPPEEFWYSDAKSQGGLNIILDKDPESGFVLTASHPIFYDNGSLIGVVSIDLPFEVVEENIAGERILVHGFAFMLDENKRLVIHPELLEDYSLFGEEYSSFPQISNIYANLNGTYYAEIDGEDWIVSFSTISREGFKIIITVPMFDIEQPSKEMVSAIRNQNFFILAIISLIIILLVLLAANIGRKATKMVIDPIEKLSENMRNITLGNIDDDINRAEVISPSKDLAILHQNFGQLVAVLKSANQAYLSGHLNEAENILKSVKEIFERLEIKKGQGIVLNNLGAVYARREDIDSKVIADRYFKQAIVEGVNLANDISNPDQLININDAIAKRYNNKAILNNEIRNFDRAEKDLITALSYAEKAESILTKTLIMGNLVTTKLGKNQLEDAKRMLDKSLELAYSTDDDLVIAYGMANKGSYFRKLGEYGLAIEAFLEVITHLDDNKVHDNHLLIRSYNNILEMYEEQGKMTLAEEIKATMQNSGLVTAPIMRHVYFVLDISGSMHGTRLAEAKSGIKHIYKLLDDKDMVKLIPFSSRVNNNITTFTPKGQGYQKFMNALKRLSAKGGTAFYDAVNTSLSLALQNKQGNAHVWIIALTDGQDNSSTLSFNMLSQDVKHRILEDDTVNLYVIGVGTNLDVSQLEELAENANGEYLHVDETSDRSLFQVFEEIGASMITNYSIEGF